MASNAFLEVYVMIKKINMQTRILLTIIPIAIVPIFIIAGFSAVRFFNKLKEQSNVFYYTVLKQVTNNVDFIYNQYSLSFVDISLVDNFKKIVSYPQFKSQLEERELLESLGENGSDPRGGSITRTVFTRFTGPFHIVEFDKSSLIDNTNYKIFRFNNASTTINGELLKKDPLVNYLRENRDAGAVFGRPGAGVLVGYESEQTSLFIYPYYENETGNLNKLMIVTAGSSFFPSLYKDIQSLKLGTLYVLDRNNAIIARNHPSQDDIYEYDPKTFRYKLSKDDPVYDEFEEMGIKDYRLLNTDENILSLPEVKKNLDEVSSEEYKYEKIKIVTFKRMKYLFVSAIAPNSNVKLVYFHPLSQVYEPINKIVMWIIVTSLIIILLVVFISILLSKFLVGPIKKLSEGVTRISANDYKTVVNTSGFFGEFVELGNTFNSMCGAVSEYSEHMEDLVKQRTEALNKANEELSIAYEENRKELMMAQRIQMSLIPKIFPDVDKLDFSGIYLPMEALGGDLYDVFKITDTKIGLVILDVCGHGIPAALITTMAKISFNTNAKKLVDPLKVMAAVNNELCDAIQESGDYFTAFYCVIDTEKKTMQYSNAAHNDIYILRESGELVELSDRGPVVGVLKQVEYTKNQVELNTKDRLVLYTDGVIEARNVDRVLYDKVRFKEVIIQNKDVSSKEFVNFLYNDILTFKNNVPHDDDIAILVVDMI